MKKQILSIIVLTIAQITIAQNTIAKFKFEEAEQAFVNNDYKQTISKLDEAEALLKSTNPKILHLKILAQSKIIESDPLVDYALIEDTRKLSKNYLKDYEKLPNNEDKYREIYYLNEKLKEYPSSSQEFEIYKSQQKIADDKPRYSKSNNVLANEEAFMNFVYFKDFKIGLSLDKTYKLYPNYKNNTKINDPDGGFSIVSRGGPIQGLPYSLSINKNIVNGYYDMLVHSQVDDAQFSIGKKTLTDLLNKLYDEFLFSPEEIINESTSVINENEFHLKGFNYTWSKNNKFINIYFTEVTYMNENLSSIHIYSKDENLIK